MVAFPCDFRVGSTGFGLIGGIGAGVGFLKPLQLGGIPAVGQIAGTLASSLSTFDSALGNPGDKVRQCYPVITASCSKLSGPEVLRHSGQTWDTKISSQRP